ncbi:Peptidoglycan-synthase activator LpoB [Desulfacinum hydrothermale DSM 13146]|uniref:Peptidoglycan-synthase activator LpoB n=1 Tax=Desulfacinum hydrothermale DSM 13146 TaxID=1121390 RepID=A0A1W1X0B0_9BACT|nr:FG-GAP-like repeat-containing protein [Desulfacinum hydrothermale]SMC17220.1 Peptidoglycan-synthase activator LpoB [Desulfacinum hydrothermale DSM 13146]
MKYKKSVLCFLAFSLVSFWITAYCQASQDAPKTVAIMPFKMNTPDSMRYLQDGVWDMLRTRIEDPGSVHVVDKAAIDKTAQSIGDLADSGAARGAAERLGADYVLFGSITSVGQAVSIDATISPVTSPGAPIRLPFQADTLDQLIPTINRLAQTVNRKVFNKANPSADETITPPPTAENMNPELLIPGGMKPGMEISYLNPNFIQVTPEGAMRQAGLWRSQTFKEALVSIAAGDPNGDGRQELIAVSPKRLAVYRRYAQGLRLLTDVKANKLEEFKWVALADVDGDGKVEILLTSVYRQINPTGGGSESITSGAQYNPRPRSYVFKLQGKKLTVAASDVRMYLNAVTFPNRGSVALGQKPGPMGDLFDSTLYEVRLRGGQLIPAAPVSVPSPCNVYNFAVADLNNDKAPEYAVISPDNRLMILDGSGNRLWRSRLHFAATTNVLEGKIRDLRYNDIERYFIPSPILIMDANRDGIHEIVVNRSPDYSRFLPQGFKYYEAGEIVSLSWDQLGLIENWKTREVSGMVSCIRTGDLNGDGTPELIASLVLGKDLLKLWEARSTVFSYDLNVGKKGSAETTRKRQ